jgi:hypothetical protein
MTSEKLISLCFEQIINHEESLNSGKQIETKNIVGFKTKDKLFVIDYILLNQNIPLDFLKNNTLHLVPIYKEIKMLQNV